MNAEGAIAEFAISEFSDDFDFTSIHCAEWSDVLFPELNWRDLPECDHA